MIEKYFIDSLYIIEKNEIVPYYLESKVKDLSKILTIDQKGDIINFIVKMDHAVDGIRYFSKNKILYDILPFLEELKSVPQDKGRSKNAFEHTLNVLSIVPSDNVVLRWVALLHDSGKLNSFKFHNNFYHHAKFSKDFAESFLSVYKIINKEKICNIIENHMIPLDYQRNPNWGDGTIIKFIEKLGEWDVLDTIEFSYYDKKAENDVKEYLQIILDLRAKVIHILEER